MRDAKYDGLPEWVGMFPTSEPDDFDLVAWLKAQPVDHSPEAVEARRVAGGVCQMTVEEIKEVVGEEVKRRLDVFDKVWGFVVGHDTSAWANGWGYLAASTEGEWYETGARETLDQIRRLMNPDGA